MSLTDLNPRGAFDDPNAAQFKDSRNPVDLIASGRGYLDTLANKWLLKPANAKGLAGFIFDYEGDTQITIQADITDHYSEENTFFNDQAAQKPQRVILRGFVGEIVANPNTGVLGALATLQNKLTTLPALLGKYTPGAVQKISSGITQATQVVNKIDNAINRAQNIVGLFTGSTPAQTKQEKAYQNLYALWANNTVFTLDTPFNYFRSVMIESIIFLQDETTKQWSEVNVTVKEVRFLGNPQGPGLSAQAAAFSNLGRSVQQSQGQVNKGIIAGITTAFKKATSFFGTRNQVPIG